MRASTRQDSIHGGQVRKTESGMKGQARTPALLFIASLTERLMRVRACRT
jgi:hypothetical protein